MNPVSEDIKVYIESTTDHQSGKDLFVGREPASPPNVVTIFDSPDAGPWLGYSREDGRYEYGAFQIRVRNGDYRKAFQIANSFSELLHGLGNTEINGEFYTLIQALDNPAFLEWDSNNRAKFVINFHIQRTK